MRSLRTTNWPSNTRLVDDFFLDFDRMFDGFFDRTPSAAQAGGADAGALAQSVSEGWRHAPEIPVFNFKS